MTRRWAARGLQLAGALTAMVSLFHAVALFAPGVSDPSPPWRHALFVGVNAFFAWGYLTRASWLPVPFAILFAQQTWSHGTSFVEALGRGHVDAQSLAVLVSLPVLAVLVWLGRKPRVTLPLSLAPR